MSNQGYGEWFKGRCGFVTASRFGDVIGKDKEGKRYLKAHEDYLIEIVTERLTGEPVMKSHGFIGEHGKTLETYARHAFEAETGIMVKEVDFIRSQDILNTGCSPDGLISGDELSGLEIKCPASSVVHLKTVLAKKMPDEHMAQVQGGMWITGAKNWYFASYDARMPPHLRLFYQKIERDDKYIEALQKEVVKFLNEIAEFMDKLPKAA